MNTFDVHSTQNLFYNSSQCFNTVLLIGEACEKVRQEARQMVVRGDIDSKQVSQKIGNIYNVVFDLMLAAQWSNFKVEARLDLHCEKSCRTFRCSFKEYHPDVE
jgi:hypothetical protein